MQMELYVIIISVIIMISTVWIFFHTVTDNKPKEFIVTKLEDEKKLVKSSELVKKKKEIYYKFNTHAIKLNLYPKSKFGNYRIEEIYQEIIIDNYWLDEPFHTEFSKILKFYGSNNLWIKDPKSREIIMNVRDNTNKIKKHISMNILALNEVLYSVIIEVCSSLKDKKEFTKYDIQNSILSASIYILSESGEIEFICQTLGIKYINKDDLRFALIDKIYENLSSETKIIIAQNNFIDSINFTSIYDEILFNVNQYPYTFSRDEPKIPTIKLLPYIVKKQLISI